MPKAYTLCGGWDPSTPGCHRVIWTKDADAEGFCCFCSKEVMPSAVGSTHDSVTTPPAAEETTGASPEPVAELPQEETHAQE